MLGQLAAAQFDLESAVAELMGSGGNAAPAQSQLQAILAFQRQVGAADAASLAAMPGGIAGIVAEARAIAQQGRESAAAVEAALAVANARTRAIVQRIAGDLFERRIFDPYLQFASTAEEEAYRRREAERRAYTERELARGTPQGNLNASNATLAQIEDAGAHGADRSPEYQRTRTTMRNARDEQLEAMRSASANSPRTGVDTSHDAISPATDLDEIAAVFRAAGVQSPQAETAHRSGHGLAGRATERDGVAAARFS